MSPGTSKTMVEVPWQFREIDSSLFKAFWLAAKELNFTRAAEKAAMTQGLDMADSSGDGMLDLDEVRCCC